MKPAAWFALSRRHKPWRPRPVRWQDLAGVAPSAVPIWDGSAAFAFDALNAQYFADALMMDRVGIAIPSGVQKRKP